VRMQVDLLLGDFYTRSGLPEDNNPTSRVLVMLEDAFTLLLYPRGQGYKEVNRVSYNMIPIRTLYLFPEFTYLSIDIAICALRDTSWSSGRCNESMGRRGSLGHLSRCS
jgi:hypothetical protein